MTFMSTCAVKGTQVVRLISHFGKFRQMVSIVFTHLILNFDTVSTLYDASCDGEQIMCNDDANDDIRQSEIRDLFLAGEEFYVVVDGYSLMMLEMFHCQSIWQNPIVKMVLITTMMVFWTVKIRIAKPIHRSVWD